MLLNNLIDPHRCFVFSTADKEVFLCIKYGEERRLCSYPAKPGCEVPISRDIQNLLGHFAVWLAVENLL